MRFEFAHAQFWMDPYPIGLALNVLDMSDYIELADTFPPLELFSSMPAKAYNKHTLSPRFDPEQYKAFLATSKPWRRVYDYVQSPDFLGDVATCLSKHQIPFPAKDGLTTRFEFSSLPANGGFLAAHRDIPSKVATLILPMLRSTEEWDPQWGGGTDVLQPKEGEHDLRDYMAPLSAFETVRSLAYWPNRAVIFIRSDHSWHSVGPIQGPKDIQRKTITINIEAGR